MEKTLDKISKTDEYQKLIQARARIVWPLSVLMMGVYYAYILVIAFKPDLFATKISEDMHTTWGIVIGIGVIFFAFLMTGIYVHKANKELEPLTEKLQEKFGDKV